MEHLALEQVPWFNKVTNKLGVLNDFNPNICKTVSKKKKKPNSESEASMSYILDSVSKA